MSVHSIAKLQACLDNVKQFQERYNEEQAKATRNQVIKKAYDIALAAWSSRKAQRDEKLAAGHYAELGYVWNSNTGALIHCNSTPKTGTGPFDLCGYTNIETKLCVSASRAVGFNQTAIAAYQMAGGVSCNCASCAEGCCLDGSPNGPLKYNPTKSSYQNTWNQLEASDPRPVQPALEQLLPITFSIQCSECSQSVGQGTVTQTQINQTIYCLNNQLITAQQQAAAEALAAKTAVDAKAAADKQAQLDAIANNVATQKAAQEAAQEAAQKASQEAAQKIAAMEMAQKIAVMEMAQKTAAMEMAQKTAEQTMQMLYIMIVVFILVVVAGLAAYYYMSHTTVSQKI